MVAAGWTNLVDFAHPAYLAALAGLPLVVALGLRSLSGLGSVQRALAIAVRCAVILAMLVALAGPEWVRTTDDQTIVFAVDRSDSVPSDSQRAAEQFMRAATGGMRPGKDRVGLLGFDGRASVEQVAQAELLADRAGSPIEPHRTNIAGALRLGLALLPPDTAARLVVLSDGNENVGSAAMEAESCAALGIPVDVVPLRYEHAAEMLVDQLIAPAWAKRDEVINLQLVVRSQVAARARVEFYHNDRLVDLHASGRGGESGAVLQLDPGPNRLTIPVMLRAAGVHRFRAVLQPDPPESDTLPQNNEGRAFTIVGATERVLLVVDTVADAEDVNRTSAQLLAQALRNGGIECEQLSVDELPGDPAVLADCSAVILANVSAFALGPPRQAMLASYVRDQGGGLIAIGGDRAFSVGGYGHTPLEEILPVETSRDKLKLLSLGLVIVLDRSGSMMGEKIAMARQAAMAAVQLLSSFDRIGVVAFDSAPEWVVPLQPAGDKAAIAQQIATIGVGGGTNMYPALLRAGSGLADLNTNLKHIIVLTDGLSMPGDFDGFARHCAAAGITVSAIAVGPDADRALLARIAQLSGGRMYVAESAKPLPQIFVRETVLASRSGLFEQPFTPRLVGALDSQIVEGLEQPELPPLRGHVVTAAKPLAQTPLVRVTEDGTDPILAHWQVGLGRTVAFTSGIWPKWGPQWAAWSGFSKFWTQAVRYAGRPGHLPDLEVETTIKDGQAHVVVSAEHLPLRLQGSLTLVGQFIRPDFSVEPLTLRRTAAGRFEADFPAHVPGTYLVNMSYRYGTGEDGQAGVLRSGVVMSYSPEYRTLGDNAGGLAELARRTGGRVLDVESPAAVFEAWSIRPVRVRRPFWEDLVRLALLLFLVDVAVRRIAVTPAEAVARAAAFVRELSGRAARGDSAATLTALRGVKARVRDGGTEPRRADVTKRADAPRTGESLEPDSLTRALGGVEPETPVVAAPSQKRRPPAASEGEYTTRLLRAKRRARREPDEDGRK